MPNKLRRSSWRCNDGLQRAPASGEWSGGAYEEAPARRAPAGCSSYSRSWAFRGPLSSGPRLTVWCVRAKTYCQAHWAQESFVAILRPRPCRLQCADVVLPCVYAVTPQHPPSMSLEPRASQPQPHPLYPHPSRTAHSLTTRAPPNLIQSALPEPSCWLFQLVGWAAVFGFIMLGKSLHRCCCCHLSCCWPQHSN